MVPAVMEVCPELFCPEQRGVVASTSSTNTSTDTDMCMHSNADFDADKTKVCTYNKLGLDTRKIYILFLFWR